MCCLTLRCESFSQPPSASLGARITASRAKSSSSSNPLHANEIDDATVVTKSTSLGNLRVPPKIPFAVDKVSSSSSAFERVQRGLARLSKSVPKTVILTVVAVASGLIFFELTKTLLMLALPVIAVLGKDKNYFMPVLTCLFLTASNPLFHESNHKPEASMISLNSFSAHPDVFQYATHS